MCAKLMVTPETASNALTLEEALRRLAASEAVDGIALFGARITDRRNPVSDHDVLILVSQPPVNIFQMLTHIDGRLADVVFIATETADRALENPRPVAANSSEGLFLLKMRTAHVVYDAAGRLQRIQQWLAEHAQTDWLLPPTEAAVYAAWFWQNHGLYHLKRMVQSDEPVYQTAVDLLLLACLSQICRDYCCLRNLPWQGEKAALRHLQEHDPGYLAQLRECLAATDRAQKVNLYGQLVQRTLAPVGPLWTPGVTAVYLNNPAEHITHLDAALEFWESLLQTTP